MIGHFLKLVWNRRRANALIMIELLLSFVGLSVILTFAFTLIHHYRQPLGFEYENVWRVDLDSHDNYYINEMTDAEKEAVWIQVRQLEQMFEEAPEVLAASPMTANVPYGGSSSGSTNFVNGESLFVRIMKVKPEMMEVLRFQLLSGRWIEQGDEAMDWNPVVLTRNYAEALFGTEDPIGKVVPMLGSDGALQEDADSRRVVGVVQTFRKDGEMREAPSCEFAIKKYGAPRSPPSNYVIRLAEGVPAAFEEELVRGVQSIVPRWTVNVAPLSKYRDRGLKENVVPMMIGGGVAVFLLIMVGLGLIGVLWQNVARRTEELGLRRALGSSAGGIRVLVLGELFALTTAAIVVGAVIYAQLPLLGVFSATSFGVFALSFLVAVLGIYLVVLICGLYPSWLATRVQPAAALQYE
jgi:putative ABC transport system permease protein